MPVVMKKVKVDAWFLKKACVLVKKKISRSQWPRNEKFRELMRLALHRPQFEPEDITVDQTKPLGYSFEYFRVLPGIKRQI